ncbi:SIN3-like protein [Apodospora peruviana]|uniref:SIN3-like protein n=1 Tax=Apodospora peruviana TaxID=516989 RepID=A0AAE0ISC0_9PEZI|nr:SIN3-like protein [Apodospora peruviana]
MKLVFLPALALSAIVSSQLVVPLRGPPRPLKVPSLRPFNRDQAPLMDPAGPGPAMPPSDPSVPANPPSDAGGEVILSDVMGRDRSINLYAGFVRDIESAERRLDDSTQNTTVLAPLNSAIEKLPRKPWEDPRDYGALGPDAYEGDDGPERAQRNLRKFVEAHMIPLSPWPAGMKVKPIGDDQDVWWEEKAGIKVVQPGNIEVVSVASTVANGQVVCATQPIAMNTQPLHGGNGFDRDRDMEEQRHRALQQDEARREREQRDRDRERDRDRDRDEAERQHREPYQPTAAHHSTAGSIPIHQPVASRVANTIHSPGGLLANHGGSAPSIPIGASSGPAPGFGGPLHADSNRPPQHGGPGASSAPQHQMFAPMPHGPGGPNGSIGGSGGPAVIFGGPLQQENGRGIPQEGGRGMQQIPFATGMGAGHPMPPGPGGMPQVQQPILNDALSYLDQVKVQFHEQPDVYNKFLDIMKDFKSQTINTPGVISRVSDLFAGHPNLIQGFNTFLPPGYRIECGLENNPNSIRVTTPSGSTIQTIGAPRPPPADTAQPAPAPGQAYLNARPPNWQPPAQHSVESPEAAFSMPAQNGPPVFPASSQASFESTSPAQQRAVPATQNGQAANHAPAPRNVHTPTPTAGPPNSNGGIHQAIMEKRGPVEFNHAISYVNKIKNRFQDKPEIYKQFLEILQTYQREQKPIQDVYSQVTTLFHTAPDLLEDFKQFLPESAAQTRPGGQRPDEGAPMSVTTPTPQQGHPVRDGPKMPPVGNFAPPASATKEAKKRPRTDKAGTGAGVGVITPSTSEQAPTSALRGSLPSAAGGNKRAKLTHKPGNMDGTFVQATLTPVAPEPLGPGSLSMSSQDDFAFFDRVKKHIGNRTAMTEFLKLINLFNLELITKDTLIYKANQFFGGNPELLGILRGMFQHEGEEEVIENRPEPPTGRVSLSNCRGLGPSYRLLPKRERLKPCSGRDELCQSVLNDEWASHPTWASEDSGFVAHRKNGYEEGLHRIEEERHDYDFYIEANQKCIQLLEPIAQQMLTLSPADRATFKMPAGLGGQSTSIYKRVLKKIYGPEKGCEVTNEMFKNPFSVVPIVMARLKQKDEEWRFTQREWEKVWQSQTETMHLKSLDHMGIQVKTNDKRNLAAKHLVDIIKTKHEEQARLRASKNKTPRYQFNYSFQDQDLLLDLLRFMIIYANVGGQHNAQERRRILEFFETFIPQFFDLPDDKVQEKLADIDQESGEEDEDEPSPVELSNGRTRRNGKKSGLLRGVLDPGRNGSRTRAQKEDSAAAGSKETTPDVGSANEEEMPDAPEDNPVPEVSNGRWLPTVPGPIIVDKSKSGNEDDLLEVDGGLKADAPFPRAWYNFYCNQNIYVFFTVFQTLFKRLQDVKNDTESVLKEIRREKAEKPAKILGLAHGGIHYFDSEDETTFWPKTVELIEDFINGETDESRYQEVLRHYYLKKGWTIYTIQDLLKTLCRIGLACNNPDAKGEKTKELVKAYLESRHQDETSYQNEISARKFAEKCIKDGEMFVICWTPSTKEASVRWLQKDETTFYMDQLERIQQWQYYISSYMRIEHTEGIQRSRLQKVLLERNLPSDAKEFEDGYTPKPLVIHEGLVVRICLNSSKMVFEKCTSDYFVYNTKNFSSQEDRAFHEDQQVFHSDLRGERLKMKMVENNAWMKGMSHEEVQMVKDGYQKWKEGETLAPPLLPGEVDNGMRMD